jgi:hypothetical protein
MKYGCINGTLKLLSIMWSKSIRGSGKCSKSRKRCSQFHVVGKFPTPRPFAAQGRKQVSKPRSQQYLASLKMRKQTLPICLTTVVIYERMSFYSTRSRLLRVLASTIVYNSADYPTWPQISHVQ